MISDPNHAMNRHRTPNLAHLFAAIALSVLPMQGYAQDVSPTEPFANRDTYYPNTEALAEDEIRVIACGTGMPTTRASQAAACFLVELGNGDKFLFDVGSGSGTYIVSADPL